MTSIAKSDLLATLTGRYRDEANEATPNNSLISRREQRGLSDWSQSVADRLRSAKGKGARITVDEYVAKHARKISRGGRRRAGSRRRRGR